MIQLEEKLYTSTEVAEILGVSLRSVYRYLEENKLQAEVKTATGRHRFSKQNILEFLYPDGMEKSPASEEKKSESKVDVKVDENSSMQPDKQPDSETTETMTDDAQKSDEAIDEEPIDWLAKFREAAKKFREESEDGEPTPAVEVEAQVEEVVQKVEVVEPEPAVKVSDQPAFEQETVTDFAGASASQEKTSSSLKHYYRSGLGGLKDIAQNIDKNSRGSFLDYAFTLNAGLSLFKPIKPFSMLHAYVRPGDMAFYEKTLALTPTEEGNAQLCLIISDDNSIYSNREELHGLFVVSKERLAQDVKTMGDSALASEAQSVLG